MTQANDDRENPRWALLTPAKRLELMESVFQDDSWYDGDPYYDGGQTHPNYYEVSRASGAPSREVRKFYAAWLRDQGFDPKVMNEAPPQQEQTSGHAPALSQPSQPTVVPAVTAYQTPAIDPAEEQMMKMMTTSSGSNEMPAMMMFLMQQQRMAAEQSRFQTDMQMQQRRFDEQRSAEMRREQMTRDQQFMTQQMTLMKETMSRSAESDGFFDGAMKAQMKEKFVEQLMGGGDDSWKDTAKEILTSDTLKSAVSGLGTALAPRQSQQVPAGYDTPGYNPYAQQMPAPAVAQQPMGMAPSQETYQPPMQAPPPAQSIEPQTDGVFFEEEVPQATQIPEEVSEEEYRQILINSFGEMLGPAMEDPQVAKAVQEQINVAVQVTLFEMPEALPQLKLQRMSEKMLLVRNLRDICFGLRDLRTRIPPGQAPNGIVMAAVVTELRKRPEFYKIFAENTYESVIAQLDPFKNTGAIKFDYEYLLRPDMSEVARHLLGAVQNDAQVHGLPQ